VSGNFFDGRRILNGGNITELSCRYAGSGQGDIISIIPISLNQDDSPMNLSHFSAEVTTVGGQNSTHNNGNETRIFAVSGSGNPQSVKFKISQR